MQRPPSAVRPPSFAKAQGKMNNRRFDLTGLAWKVFAQDRGRKANNGCLFHVEQWGLPSLGFSVAVVLGVIEELVQGTLPPIAFNLSLSHVFSFLMNLFGQF